MNNHESNSCVSDEWHQNLLEGCNDVVNRLMDVVEILRQSHLIDRPASHRLRLIGQHQEIVAPTRSKQLR